MDCQHLVYTFEVPFHKVAIEIRDSAYDGHLLLKPEIIEWLNEHVNNGLGTTKSKMAWSVLGNHQQLCECIVELMFADPDDCLLCKLTWGGL